MSINSFEEYILSWKPDKNQLTPPYYKALADDLEYCIRSGQLCPGTKLPPQREIADYLELNLSTITKAYNICQEKGLIVGAMGKGTFVARHYSEDSTLAIYDSHKLIDMSALSCFSEKSQLVEDAARRVLSRQFMSEMFGYSYPMGMPHQLAAGIRWMEQLGAHADITRTSIVSGGQNALMVSLLALFSPGDCVAVEKFSYASFIEMAKLINLKLIPVETDSKGMRPDDLRKKCRTNRIKGIYLMPSCTNPTTVMIPEERRDELADVIRDENLILIEDDIASWLALANGMVYRSMFDRLPEQSVYICGMSKSLCPGLRIAYLAYSEQFQEKIQKCIFNVNVKTSALDAEIITELLVSGDAYTLIKNKKTACRKAGELFERYFPGQSPAQDCFFRWVPIPQTQPGSQIEAELERCGVRVFHSARFAVDVNDDQAYLRVSICSAGSLHKLEQGLQIIKKYLEDT